MPNNYNWKDRYINYAGADITNSAKYFSLLASHKNYNDGTRENPCFSGISPGINSASVILSGGYHRLGRYVYNPDFVGNGVNTYVDLVSAGWVSGITLKDLTISEGSSNGGNIYMRNCQLVKGVADNISESYNSLITEDQTNFSGNGSNNSYLGLSNALLSAYKTNLSLYAQCKLSITQDEINGYNSRYNAFDNCLFKIGAESDFTPLTGTTEAELREDFRARCVAQGLTVPTGSEFGDVDLPMYRWVFANNATSVGAVITDSIIDNFQKRRFVQLGWKTDTVQNIAITTQPNVPNSFSNWNYTGTNPGLIVEDGSMSGLGYLDTNIIYLGFGKKKLNPMAILHTLLEQYGIFLDSTPDFETLAGDVSSIQEGEFYLLRSTNENEATATYNGITYSSSLATRNNIIVGVSGITEYTKTDNAKLYRVFDLSLQHTVQMRIVHELPPEIITSGQLAQRRWYFVEPNDLNNPNGYVEYNGVQYPPFSSFLTDTTNLDFTISGDCHLRRCWYHAITKGNLGTNDPDYAFWNSRQAPWLFDVDPFDPRCFMKNDDPRTNEMEPVQTEVPLYDSYFASGRVGFYNLIMGINGQVKPSFPITGTFMQLRFYITNNNPV